MSLFRTIFRNTLFQATGRIISTILAIFIVALITRYLGTERFGNFTTIIAFLQFFGIIIDFGIMLVTIQMVSEKEYPKEKLLGNLFSFRILSAVLILMLAPIVVSFFPYPETVKNGVSLTIAYFFFIALNQVMIGFLQQSYSAGKIAIAEVLSRFGFFAGVLLTLSFDWGLSGVIWAITMGSFLNFFINFIFVWRIQHFELHWNTLIIKNIIVKSWPLAVGIIFNLVYLKADTLILALYRSQEEVGWYGAPYRVLEILMSFPAMFLLLLMPTFIDSWKKENRPFFLNTLQHAFDGLIMITFPMVAGTIILSQKLMVFIAGDAFTPSGKYLAIIMLAAGILFLGQLFGHAIVAINKQRATLWVYALGAIFGLLLYFFLIPKFGALGAAWGTVLVEGVVNTLLFLLLWKHTGYLPHLGITWRVLLASALMSLALWKIPMPHVVLSIIFGAGIYIIFLYIFGGIKKKMIREILEKKT